MKVLITGSHGYIGSVLSSMFKERGDMVIGCDNDLDKDDPPNIFARRLRSSFDEGFVISMVLLYKIDVIVHLAAASTIGPDSDDPLWYHYNNTARTISLLHKLHHAGWKGHIIFASTAAVYASSAVPVHELDIISPGSVYGRTKLDCEKVLKHWDKTTVFRFFNVAGAHNGFGEEAEDTHLISKISTAALNRRPVCIYGGDYPTRDGTCVRDYVHVYDICSAIIFSAEQEVYGTYNLGTQTGFTVKEVIEQFNMHTGQNVEYTIGERRPGDEPFLVANPSWFERKTGFTYKYKLRDIINSSWEYFKNGI